MFVYFFLFDWKSIIIKHIPVIPAAYYGIKDPFNGRMNSQGLAVGFFLREQKSMATCNGKPGITKSALYIKTVLYFRESGTHLEPKVV